MDGFHGIFDLYLISFAPAHRENPPLARPLHAMVTAPVFNPTTMTEEIRHAEDWASWVSDNHHPNDLFKQVNPQVWRHTIYACSKTVVRLLYFFLGFFDLLWQLSTRNSRRFQCLKDLIL